MPRFAVIDPAGDGLSWAARLKDEGNDVLYYAHEKHAKHIGEGIVPKTNSMFQLLAWAKEKPSFAVFMFSGMGKRSDKVPVGADEFRRAGVPTILGGSVCDRLEHDRRFGMKFAEKAGVRTPPFFEFATIAEASAFCKSHKTDDWYFKTDSSIDCDATKGGSGEKLGRYLDDLRELVGNNKKNIVQMQVPGVDISTAAWFNGHTFLGPYEGTLEDKKMMNDGVGPSTGCSLNAVWFYTQSQPKIVRELKFDKLGPMLVAAQAPPGLYDINAIVSSKDGPWGPAGVPYFLEWTPRCGWDSESTSPRLWTVPMWKFLVSLAQGTMSEVPVKDKIGYSIHLGLSPWPYEHIDGMRKTPLYTPLHGFDSVWKDQFSGTAVGHDDKRGFYMAHDFGSVGLSIAVGDDLVALNDKTVKYAKSLEPTNMIFRTDGAKVLGADARKLKSLGYEMPEGIMVK